MPLVKSLFNGLKDVSRFFEQGGDKQVGRPVSVSLPLADGDIRLVGFVMQENARLPSPRAGPDASSDSAGDDQDAQGRIAVYLPMSYQVGGYTLYLDPTRVHALDVSPDDALRAVLTGGSLKGAETEPERADAPEEAEDRPGGEAEPRRVEAPDTGAESHRDETA